MMDLPALFIIIFLLWFSCRVRSSAYAAKKHFTPSLHLDEKQLLAADVKICLLIPAVRTDPSVSPESERPDMVELIQLEEKNPFKCAYCT